jgi:putative DNA primase/helicase
MTAPSGSPQQLDIRLKHEGHGEHRAACPECAKAKHRPRDDALAVKVEPDGAATWLCHRCGWKGSTRAPGRAQGRREPPAKGPQPPTPETRQEGFPGAPAALWRACRVITPDCPAGRYLTARGCAPPHPDGDLRRLDDHLHPCGWRGPCMVALVTDAVTVEPMTLHRTWIMPDGTKAPVDRPRLLWPGLPKAGGVVRLWPDEEVTLGLLIGEGIESSLTAAHGFQPVWACLDKGNMADFPVLAGIDCLTIVADHDRDGGGQRAAESCARRWLAAGVETRVWMSESLGQDFNDFAGGGAAA